MEIQNQNIDTIKELISVKSIVEDAGIKLRGSRSDCPFCTGSSKLTFSINDKKGYGHCFRCGYSGDVFSLYQELNGCDFKIALAHLAAKCGITLSSDIQYSNNPKPKTEKDLKLQSCRQTLRDLEKEKENIDLSFNAEIDLLAERGFIAQEIIDDVDRQFAKLDFERLKNMNEINLKIERTRSEISEHISRG